MNTKEERYREEFEKYVNWHEAPRDLNLKRYEHSKIDDYVDFDTYEAWLAYLAGRKAGEEEISQLKVELKNSSRDVWDKHVEIESLKKENERLNNRIKAHESGKEYYLSENQKLKNLVERAKPYINRSYFSDDMPSELMRVWLKEAEEGLK